VIYPDYDTFLISPKWAALREVALQRDGYACRLCGSPASVQVHHRRYRRTWDQTRLDDLTCLCAVCHGIHEGRLPAVPIPLRSGFDQCLTILGFAVLLAVLAGLAAIVIGSPSGSS